MKIYMETYGCASSLAESEIMSGLLSQAGFLIVEDENQADLAILVTCYVKTPTEQKILMRIGELCKKKLIIAGCMPEGVYDKIVSVAPNASMVSTHHIKDIALAANETLKGIRVEFLGKSNEVKLCLPKDRKNKIIGIVPISSGCNSKCTYCCVRHAKGSLFSYPKEMILKEVEASLKDGCKEIWLTAQDTASYGYDNKENLPKLISEITSIPGDFKVRVGMMNPRNVMPIINDLIEAFKNEKVYKFIHLPLQSGSDDVLFSMNRGYSVSQFEEIFKIFRKSFKCQIWTDAIVGYPTESDEDFLKTVELVKKLKPDWVNVSKFGARPSTEASNMKALPAKIVNDRSKMLSELAREISLENNSRWLGWEGGILVFEKGRKGQWIGKNSAYKSVVIDSRDNLMGNLLRVKIIDFSNAYLVGELA
ncbi:MAG: tRNA (N(6)-L-threonylcarbamoyladenosine(37)-C(2))-methylthiotransferase [Candidatus Aenigmatarchaeota archaeon]